MAGEYKPFFHGFLVGSALFEKERIETKPSALWTAVAERSGDTAFALAENFRQSHASRKGREGVLLCDLCDLCVRHLLVCRKRRRRSALPAQSITGPSFVAHRRTPH